jgi:iron complex transport system substrate-binding protein
MSPGLGRTALVGAAIALSVTGVACRGGTGGDEPTATTSESVPGDGDEFTPVASDDVDVPSTPDDAAVIGTDDGSTPSPTTDPAVVPGPDEPPPVDGPIPTIAPIPVPAGADVGRIVSLSATHTETLFALGLDEFVVAVDAGSDYPAAAAALADPTLDESLADIDPILALDPDVVILGDDPTGMAGRLSAAGVASYSGPSAGSLDDIYDQIRDIAGIVDRSDLGEQLVENMRAAIDAIVASLPAGALDAGLTFFHEIDPSLFTPGSESFFSELYGTLGLANIAGPGGAQQTAQMTDAAVIDADPDVIVLADAECCAVTPDRVAGRPGWADVSAVRNGAVVEVTDALSQRWGPRVVELLRIVARGVSAAAG